MKIILFAAFSMLFTFGAAQYTYIPDENFEQALIDLGYDDVLDQQVLTENISSIHSLELHYRGIADLTGINDFTNLAFLHIPIMI